MSLSPSELSDIAARASGLDERLLDAAPRRAAGDVDVTSLLAAWRANAGAGDEARFARRVAWAGLDVATAVARLAPMLDVATPSWARTIDAVLDAGREIPVGADARARAGDGWYLSARPAPFEEVYWPFVRVAAARVSERLGERERRLAEEVRASLWLSLVVALSDAATRPIYLDFVAYRFARRRTFGGGGTGYQGYVEAMLGGRLARLFSELPVLARRMGLVTEQWIDATVELGARLDADWAAIARRWGAGERVISILPALSDRHNGGRVVHALGLESGRAIVYKPRPVGLEEAFASFIEWANGAIPGPRLRAAEVLERGDYGWMEYVPPSSCNEVAQHALYYRRAGKLLALVHALVGEDLHHENLIAAGEHPVLIDLEALLHPRIAVELEPTRTVWAESVLASGLLPGWHIDAAGSTYDPSGLGAAGSQETGYAALHVQHVNTDQMDLSVAPVVLEASGNSPFADAASRSARDHVGDLLAGFDEAYRVLLAERATLRSPLGPIAPFFAQRGRLVLRPTNTYAAVLSRADDPSFFHDGARVGIEIDRLSSAASSEETRPPVWPLIEAERRALDAGDLPRFEVETSGTDVLVPGGGRVPHVVRASGRARVEARLESLSEPDLAFQTSCIRAAFDARFTEAIPALAPSGEPDPLGASVMEAEALAIGDALVASVTRPPSAGASWIAFELHPIARKIRASPGGEGLYCGRGGIALFLAALGRAAGSRAHLDVAREALEPLLELAARWSREDDLARTIRIGAFGGIGSMVCALDRASVLLDDERFARGARALAALLTPARIARDVFLDVSGGASGAILGLLAAWERAPDDALLAAARAAAAHLLTRRAPAPTGHRVWSDHDGRFATGVAHGAAGHGWALGRLYRATHDRALLDAAEEAIAFERALFSDSARNWANRAPQTEGETPEFQVSWCYGAPGIGLCRLALRDVIEGPVLDAEVEHALATTIEAGVGPIDHLCCGNAGRIECLRLAAAMLDRPALRAQAGRLAAQIVARSHAAGGWALFDGVAPGLLAPGLFQGVSGIGLALLGLAGAKVPSVLMWE